MQPEIRKEMYVKKIVIFFIILAFIIIDFNLSFVEAAQPCDEANNFMLTSEIKTEEVLTYGEYAKTFNSLVPEKVTTRHFLCTNERGYVDVGNIDTKGCKIEVSALNLQPGQNISVMLCNEYFHECSKLITIKNVSQKAVFYLNKSPKNYFIRNVTNYGTANINVSVSSITSVAVTGFSKAKAIPLGSAENDVLGYNTASDKWHYYKINVPQEKLVKINLKKWESSGSRDVMQIDIYKSSNTEKPVTSGEIYEGQGNAYIYIRNGKKGQTLPGTYYIIVYKKFLESGFEYSISY